MRRKSRRFRRLGRSGPLATAGTRLEQRRKPTDPMHSPFHLLVADDDDGLRESLRQILEAQGYWVAAAESGSEAIAIARLYPIHCAILDYRMGDMTGLDLVRQIRTVRPGFSSILMSAELEHTLRIEAEIAGFASCLSKPISLDLLRSTVASLLSPPRGST